MKKILLVILSFTSLALMYCNSENKNAKKVNNPSNNTVAGREIANGVKQLFNNQVCMVNDRFMNKEQIAVSVDNKTYYGCCEGCVTKLKNDSTSRYAYDGVTGEMVDKATATIILKPGTNDEVLYFTSETNAKKYIENNGGK